MNVVLLNIISFILTLRLNIKSFYLNKENVLSYD